MSCLDKGWIFLKRSFFFVSFSFWKVKVFTAFMLIRSIASAWHEINARSMLSTSGRGTAATALMTARLTGGAIAGGTIVGGAIARGGRGKYARMMCSLWHCIL